MSDIGSQIVKSVENIRTISKNTEGITEEVSVKLEEQLVAISLVAQKVNDLSKATGK